MNPCKDALYKSVLIQLDGNITSDNISISDENDGNISLEESESDDDISDNDDEDSDCTEYETEDEVDCTVNPAIFTPVPSQIFSPSKPIKLEILPHNQDKSAALPLCMMLNARSLYNKCDNFKKLLN